jgi:DNA-binding GntR family transcriptional regulator
LAAGAFVKKLRRSSLSSDAYTFIRELFLGGKRYNPGDKISVEELSRELGVSRTPLWGAINRLEAEGIVEVVPRLGVYLVNYDPQRMLDIFLVREALEGMLARIVAKKITDQQIDALETNIKTQKTYLKQGQVDRYYATALGFHEMLVEFSESHTLEKMLTSIFAQIRAMRVQKNYSPMHLPQSCNDHEKLVKAFRARNADLAENEARSHIRDLADEIQQRISVSTADTPRARKRETST